MAASTGLEGGHIGERHVALRRSEHRPLDEGVANVTSLHVEGFDRADQPVAGRRVEQPSEHRRRVEARDAPPVDRARTVDEGGGMAV